MPPADNRIETILKEGLGMIGEDPDFIKKIYFSDESYIFMDGSHIDPAKHPIWSKEKPPVIEEVDKVPFGAKINMWAMIRMSGKTCVYYFEEMKIKRNKDIWFETLTTNAQRYERMIENEVIPFLAKNCDDPSQIYFMQDGSSSHCNYDTLVFFEELMGYGFFKDIIARVMDTDDYYKSIFKTNWPAHSPDLNPCDYWLWSYLKYRVHDCILQKGAFKDPKLLQYFINHVINEPDFQDKIDRAIGNWKVRLEKCIQNDGARFHE